MNIINVQKSTIRNKNLHNKRINVKNKLYIYILVIHQTASIFPYNTKEKETPHLNAYTFFFFESTPEHIFMHKKTFVFQ